MTENEWPKSLTRAQGMAIKHYRELAGIKHDELARRLVKVGLPMQRTTLINIEQGLRKSLSVPELFAIGYVLDVPPAMLMIPLGIQPTVEPIKDQPMDSWRALGWVSGELKFGEGMYPESSADRTTGQEIRSNYSAVQALVEELLTTIHILENSENISMLGEAKKREKQQLEVLNMYLDVIRKKGLALPELHSMVMENYPTLKRHYGG